MSKLQRLFRPPWEKLSEGELQEKQTEALHEAMIGHKRIPSREGGVEIVVRELSVRMAAQGNAVDAYNRWDLFTKGGKVGKKWYHGVRIRQIPTLHDSKLNAFIYSFLASVRALFGHYDVIHYHAIGSCAMIWITHLFGKKAIVTIHGLDWQRAKWNRFATEYLRLGERMAVRCADEIIVLSKGNQQYFWDTYGRKTNLIPNGMEHHDCPVPDTITAQYGLSREDYVLYLARIVPEKGLHYLIEAFRQVNTHKQLIIAGGIDWDDAYCQKVSQMAEQDSRIQMVGLVHGREWAELFGNCCLYVLPSDIEGMPMSLLEALSFGRRCLVSDIEENVEAGKGCVSTFHHGDVEDLRRMLQFLLDNPNEGLSTGGDANWEDWDTVTQQTLALYRKVLSPNYRPTHREDHKRWLEERAKEATRHEG